MLSSRIAARLLAWLVILGYALVVCTVSVVVIVGSGTLLFRHVWVLADGPVQRLVVALFVGGVFFGEFYVLRRIVRRAEVVVFGSSATPSYGQPRH